MSERRLALDLDWIRQQFPALAQCDESGKPFVFLDGPGGTHVPERVIEAVSQYYRTINANTHGAFWSSRETDRVIATAHEAAADLLGCAPYEIVFGQNMTSLTFAISRSIGRTLGPGDEVLLTRLDHDANFAPWMLMARDCGATVRVVDINPHDCTLDMADFARQLTLRTKLVAVGMASNACGTINDVPMISRLAHDAGALVFVDAVHYAPHGPMDVGWLDCDLLSCSTYKFFGPHVGILYGRRELLERLEAYKVRPADDAGAGKWETGTQNHEGLAGVVAALDYLAELGRMVAPQCGSRREALLAAMNAIQQYERMLSTHLMNGLARIAGLSVYGITATDRFARRTPTFAVRLAGHSPRQIAQALADQGIFCWDGNFYAVNLAERLGVESTGGFLRIGLIHYNTVAEVDRLLGALTALSASAT